MSRTESNSNIDQGGFHQIIHAAALAAAEKVIDRLKQRETLVATEWLSSQNAARYCGYSEAQWAEFIRQGLAPPSVLFSKNARRFKRSDLDAWCRAGGPSPFREEGGSHD